MTTTGAAPTLADRLASDRSRMVLAGFLGVMGVLHFAVPGPFDEIVPDWVPGDARTWTYASGVAELACAGLLANRRTARIGAWAAAATIVAVYPANVQMALDNPPTTGLGAVSWARLPLQLPLLAWALAHRKAPTTPTGGPAGAAAGHSHS